MLFAYLDESKEDNKTFVYSALVVDGEAWNEAFAAVKQFRSDLRQRHGIYINKELHAWKFAAGKGRISDRVLDKKHRAIIFGEVLEFISGSGYFRIISSVNSQELYAFERLINRMNRFAESRKTNLLLFCDQGQEVLFTRRIRRMRVFNHIPSRMGAWGVAGSATRNIPIARVIEDPVFKDSRMSYFIQLVDFCAYALLRRERPLPSRTVLGYDRLYERLAAAVIREASPNDPAGLGIIR